MAAPVRVEQTVEVLTTDATVTTLYNAGAITNQFLFAVVSAQETTLLSNVGHRVFVVAGTAYTNFEAVLTVASVDAGQGGTSSGTWTAVWVNNGGNMELRVTGVAATSITWRAMIYDTPGR